MGYSAAGGGDAVEALGMVKKPGGGFALPGLENP